MVQASWLAVDVASLLNRDSQDQFVDVKVSECKHPLDV
jgi:hypothetical protein